MNGLVVHVPHASLVLPPEVRGQFVLDAAALAEEARVSADLWTDDLARAAWPDAVQVVAPVSRLVVDVERYADDALEPMAAVGRGMVYACRHDGAPLRRGVTEEEREALQRTWYEPHWRRLREAAAGQVLVDLHSYPVDPWPVEPDPAASRPAIDLGTDPALTPPEWTAALRRHFEAAGWEVGENTPYAGVIDAGARVAVMIEFRRDLVGDGPGGPGWSALVEALRTMPILVDA